MKVSEIMTTRLIVVSPDTTLDETMRLMEENRVRHFPVVDEERLIGVVSDRAVLRATGWLPSRVLEVFSDERGQQCVADVMVAPAITVEKDTSVVSACLDMLGRSIGCLPVMSGPELVGMLTEMDILALFVRHCGGGKFDTAVCDHMTRELTGISESTTLRKAAELMLSLGVRHLPVLEEGRLVGMLSDRDLERGVGSGRSASSTVEEVMSKNVIEGQLEDLVSRAAELMTKHRFSALPIVEDGQLEGMISMSDVFDICLDGLRQPEQVNLS